MVWALAFLMTLLAFVQAVHKARKGQCALLKWRSQVERLVQGEVIYAREEAGVAEGFPTLPTTALALWPFLQLEDVPAGVLWASLKIALAWWMLATCCRMAAGHGRSFPPWALVVLLLLCGRVLLSDIAHGNVNLLVAALVVAAGRAWQLERERAAGWWAGLGAVLKITPALFLAYFAWKRSPRAVLHMLAAIVVFGLLLPMLVLGPSQHLELLGGWWQQMVEPYAAGAPLRIVQTEQTNQSLLGVLARVASDATAIRARPGVFEEDVSIHVVALAPSTLQFVFRSCALALLVFGAWCACVPRTRRSGSDTLGELALVVLLMLFLSERSWKQHYVTLCVPLAYLLWTLAERGSRDRAWRWSASALACSAVLHGLSGSGILGERGSDYAEAWGAWFFGGLTLFVACGLVVRRSQLRSA